mgnify:CR=1 FL=1
MTKKTKNHALESKTNTKQPGAVNREESLDPRQAGSSTSRAEPSRSADKSLAGKGDSRSSRSKNTDVRTGTGTSGRGIPESPRASTSGRGLDGGKTITQNQPLGGGNVKGVSQGKSFIRSAWRTTTGKLALVGTGIIAAAAVTVGILASKPTQTLTGTWLFQTSGTSNCGVPYDGWEIPVWQEGKSFYGNRRPEPMVTDGRIKGNKVTFSITLLNEDESTGCGDFTDLVGIVEGNTITGTLSGADCAYICTWEGTFTVTIRK